MGTHTQARRMMFRPTAAVLCILALAGAQAQEQAAAPVAEAAPAAVEAAPATPAVEVATEAPAPVVEAVAKSAENKEVIPVSWPSSRQSLSPKTLTKHTPWSSKWTWCGPQRRTNISQTQCRLTWEARTAPSLSRTHSTRVTTARSTR